MIYKGYAALSGVYDMLNDEIDYDKWAHHINYLIKKHENKKTSLMLDLGCGTGKMTFALRKFGYDMTGIDISPEMLSEAYSICAREGIDDVLFLCQDMTEFELYGTVDAVVCCLDGINHLTGSGDITKCFSLVHNYLVPNGIFIFDVNTPYKFDNVYGKNDYILENDGVLFAWQNDYDRKKRICSFYMSVFTERKDGTWKREDAIQCERCYSLAGIKRVLFKTGFELISVTKGYSDDKISDDCDRWCICARCIKPEFYEENSNSCNCLY